LNEGNKTNEDSNKENKEKSEEEEDEEKANKKHKEAKKKKYLSPICDGLKGINTKKIFKLFNLYHIPIEIHDQEIKNNNENENGKGDGDINKEDAKNGTLEKVNENEEEQKAEKENKNEEENKDKKENKNKEENKIDNKNEKEENKKEEGNEDKHEDENNSENDEKEDAKENKDNKEKEEEKKVEYETYIKLKDLFTILSLIGCQILTVDEDDKINKELKDKMVKNGLLTKEDFMEYNFWFEKYFEYQNDLESLNDEEYEWIIDEHKDNKMSIKDFLFELWKDDTGNNVNVKQILSILKIGNYITDISNNDNKKYYDVILDNN